MAFQPERFVTRLQTTLANDIDDSQTFMDLTSAAGLPTSGQIRALISGGGFQEIVLAPLPAVGNRLSNLRRAREPVGTDSNPHPFSAGATVEFAYTAGNLTNDPRNMSAQGDLETLNADGQVTRIPAGPEGSSYFVVSGQPVSAPGVNATFTNPSTSTDLNNQYLNQYTITWDGNNQAPRFSNFTMTNAVLNTIRGQNDQDANAKKTSFLFNLTSNARACGQRIGQGITVNGYGGGDAFAVDHTVNYACGVTGSSDEGQFIDRLNLNELPTLQRTTISAVVPQSDINTTLASSLTPNGTSPVTIQVGSLGTSSPLAVGQWVVLDAGLPDTSNSSAWARMEAVKVLSVNPSSSPPSFTAVILRSHPAGAAVTAPVVVTLTNNPPTFLGAYQWGEQRDVVNLDPAHYLTGDSAYGTLGQAYFTRVSGPNWSNNMLSGGPYAIGYIALDGDDNTSDPFGSDTNALKAWYPIINVTDASTLYIYKLDQAHARTYTGRVTSSNPSKWTIRPGARILAFEGTDINSNTVVLSPNGFTWSSGHLLECVHSTSADCDGVVARVATYLVGSIYRNVYTASNLGTAVWQAAYAINSGAFDVGFSNYGSVCNIGTKLVGTRQCALQFDHTNAFSGIIWGDPPAVGASQQVTNPGIYFNPTGTVMGLEINTLGYASTLGSDANGKLRFNKESTFPSVSEYPGLHWTGYIEQLKVSDYDLYHRWTTSPGYWWDLVALASGAFQIRQYLNYGLKYTLSMPPATGTLGTYAIRTVTTSNTSLSESDRVVLVDASSTNPTIVSLAPGYGVPGGTEIIIKKTDATDHPVQLYVQGTAGTIDNDTTAFQLWEQNKWVRLVADGTTNAWYIAGTNQEFDGDFGIGTGRANAPSGLTVARTYQEPALGYTNLRLGVGLGNQPSLIWEHHGYQQFGLDNYQGTLRLINPATAVLCSWSNKGAWQPPSIADSDAPANALYYSTSANKLVYKDTGGVVNNLY